MKPVIMLLSLLPVFCSAQNSFSVIIKNETTKAPVRGATVQIKNLPLPAVSDSGGLVRFTNIPNGSHTLEITCTGYHETEKTINFPLLADTIFIFMEQAEQLLEEVTVNATRSGRLIRNTPSRVEVIAQEEVQEEASMRPGDIKMLLSESTGIQTQTTSATSGNAAIRIQGLDGRYTQILKDGFPVYAGAASGLGLLQTPPLDLKQVEIIKGACSTLYGGGAIAGLINLVTKLPTEKKEINLHMNLSSAGGLDISGFYAQRKKKAGLTFYAARNSNKAFDPASIGFSAIPKFERYTVNPKFFYFLNDKTTLSLGVSAVVENRLGGDMQYIAGHGDSLHAYFERNRTTRISTQFVYSHAFNEHNSVTLKNSIGYFKRIINTRGYLFDGSQYSSFTEASWLHKKASMEWVTGLNWTTDRFTEAPFTQPALRNYHQNTMGFFAQNTWNTAHWLTIETGLRFDAVNSYGQALLPRISLLIRMAPGLTSRMGAGFGYKPPSFFTEETEKRLFNNVVPVDGLNNQMERSAGLNGDISYKVSFEKFSFSINQFFFYTRLQHPLMLESLSNGFYQLVNIAGFLRSRGAETNIRIGYDEINLYLGYTYTNALLHTQGNNYQNPLTPKHRFNAALIYEIANRWKIGSELYYFSGQVLTDGSDGRPYWLTGLVAERLWKHFSLFINFENIGDTRQTKFQTIYTGSSTAPVFNDIYAPLEGFVVNGGIKIRL